jgi:hypothetical protein
MFPTAFLILALAVASEVAALAFNATSQSLLRRAATVYTSCTTPNTAALTFVGEPVLFGIERELTFLVLFRTTALIFGCSCSAPQDSLRVTNDIHRNEIVDRLDAAGAKGTFFFSKLHFV